MEQSSLFSSDGADEKWQKRYLIHWQKEQIYWFILILGGFDTGYISDRDGKNSVIKV